MAAQDIREWSWWLEPGQIFSDFCETRPPSETRLANARSPASGGGTQGLRGKRSELPAAAAAAAAAAVVMLGGLLGPVRRAELRQFANGPLGLHGGLHGIDPCLRWQNLCFESNRFDSCFTAGNGWRASPPDSNLRSQRKISGIRNGSADYRFSGP
jgi:hypothetical protein